MELLISGIALGCLYAIISLGFVIIYRGSQVLNFAQGEFLTLGAFIMITLVNLNIPWALAFVLTLILTGLVATFLERSVLRLLIGRPIFVTIIMTLFLGLIIRTLVVLIWGVEIRGMPTLWNEQATLTIFGAKIYFSNVGAIIVSVLMLISFFLIQKYSRIGLAMRATSFDQETSLSLGIPVGRIFALTWFIAGMFGALGGIFLGMFPNSVDYNIGLTAFRAFPAVIVGGLDSPGGAVIASLAIGLIEVYAQYLIGHDFHIVLPYLLMMLFMLVRPYGIFGKKEVERA